MEIPGRYARPLDIVLLKYHLPWILKGFRSEGTDEQHKLGEIVANIHRDDR
jgi:hypothetical protein